MLAGTTTRNAAAGVASFADLTISQSGSGYTLTAAAPGLAGATSASFAITATTGTIAGRVTRVSDGGALGGAPVQALQATLVKGSVTTGGDGLYSMAGLAPDSYDVRVSVSGYQGQTQTGITVRAGVTTTVNFGVTATPAPGIRITSPAPGSVIDRPAIFVRSEITGATGMEVGVTVNGNVALVGSDQFAVSVPVDAGTQSLTARLSSPTGTVAQDSISIQVVFASSPGLLFLTLSLGSGPAPFRVDLLATFRRKSRADKHEVKPPDGARATEGFESDGSTTGVGLAPAQSRG